jgi:hypothetical protein
MDDSIMKIVFGHMPLEQLTAVEFAAQRRNAHTAIIILGAALAVTAVVAFHYFQANNKIAEQLKRMQESRMS